MSTAGESRPAMTGWARGGGKGSRLAIAGDLYTVLVDGEDSGGAFALFETVVFPGGGPPPHRHHREQETFYVLDGEVTFQTTAQAIAAGPGTVVHLPQESIHTFRNHGSRPARMLVHTAPAGIEGFFREIGRPVSAGSAPPGPPSADEIERLLAAAPRYGIEILGPEAFTSS